MSEESTTPDLVELVVAFFEAANRRDLEARMSFFAPEAVWDLSPMGIGTFEGRVAIRRFLEDWRSSYEELRYALDEVVDLGNGVVMAVTRQDALPAGGTGGAPLQAMWVYVFIWVDGMVARVIPYSDIAQGRSAAERLAEERGYAMSQENVEFIRRGFEQYFATGEPPWDVYDEDVEVYDHDTPDQGDYRGHEGVARWLEDWGAAWAEWSIDVEEFIDAGGSVVVFVRMTATGLGSGIQTDREDAQVYTLRDAKVVRLDYYNSRMQALKAVGLAE